MTTCDNHSIYKTGSKEIAAQEGMSLTFMAKPNAREGNSCHIHLSTRDAKGRPVMAGDGPHGLSAFGEHFTQFHSSGPIDRSRAVSGSAEYSDTPLGLLSHSCRIPQREAGIASAIHR